MKTFRNIGGSDSTDSSDRTTVSGPTSSDDSTNTGSTGNSESTVSGATGGVTGSDSTDTGNTGESTSVDNTSPVSESTTGKGLKMINLSAHFSFAVTISPLNLWEPHTHLF